MAFRSFGQKVVPVLKQVGREAYKQTKEVATNVLKNVGSTAAETAVKEYFSGRPPISPGLSQSPYTSRSGSPVSFAMVTPSPTIPRYAPVSLPAYCICEAPAAVNSSGKITVRCEYCGKPDESAENIHTRHQMIKAVTGLGSGIGVRQNAGKRTRKIRKRYTRKRMTRGKN